MNTASAVLLFLYIFKLSRAEDCDVRTWYVKMTTAGAFDGKLNDDQIFVQKTINKMILNSKKDTTKRKVNCYVLEMYEEMLKPDEEGGASDTQDGKEEDQSQERNSSNKTEEIVSSNEPEGGSMTGLEDNELKSSKENRLSEHGGSETVDPSTDEGTDLHISKETLQNDNADKIKNDEMEVDETELFSDDSNDDADEEREEEIEVFHANEEHILSDIPSDDLDKLKHDEITLSSIDGLEETITIDDGKSVEILKESLVTDETDIGKIKDEESESKQADTEDPTAKEKEPIEKESEIDKDKTVDPKETENENKDKNTLEEDEFEPKDSAAVKKEENQDNGMDDTSKDSEDEKESIENKSNEEDKETIDDMKNDGSDLGKVNKTETMRMETEDIDGGYNNLDSTVGNISTVSFNTTLAIDSADLKAPTRTIGENEKSTIPFGTCRIYRSYRFDIFDQVQNRYRFVENTTLTNKTEPQKSTSHGESTLTKGVTGSSISSPVTLIYSRLVCSPCSLLMKYYVANSSCNAESVGSVQPKLKSNETQTNQTNTKSATDNNTETVPMMEAPNSVKGKEIEKDISKTPSSSTIDGEKNEDAESDTQTRNKHVDVLKVMDEPLDETESQETDEKDTDKEGTPNSSGDESHSASNERRHSDEILPPDANSDSSKNYDKDIDINKGGDEKLTTEENGPGTKQKTEQDGKDLHENTETADTVSPPNTNKEQNRDIIKDKSDDENMSETKQKIQQKINPHGNPETIDVVSSPERSKERTMETGHETDQLDKLGTAINGKQTELEEKRTTTVEKHISVDEKHPSTTEEDNKAALLLEQMQSNFDDFQEQVDSKTERYSNKLQSLELMVIRLENELLKEKLNKNNHSSTINKMENHILRLENELLKLNQSYSETKQRSDSMVKDRKKYLELDHGSQQTPAYGYSVTSARAHPISVDFQAKITYLSNLLSNQSMIIRELKTRSEYLEDQNRLLYNMIMNQTALMTQIMTRVQDLTEQNIQQRIEAQKIRQQMEQIVSKGSIVETTDSFLLNKLEEMVSDVQKRTLDEDDKVQLEHIKTATVNKDKSEEELEKYMQSESVTQTETWCGASSGICIHATIVRTACIPFSPFQWKLCIERKSNGKETQKNSLRLLGTAPFIEVILIPDTTEKLTDKLPPVVIKQNEANAKVESSSDIEKEEDLPPNTKATDTKLDSTHANENIKTVNDEQKEGDSNDRVETQSENKDHGKQGDSQEKMETQSENKNHGKQRDSNEKVETQSENKDHGKQGDSDTNKVYANQETQNDKKESQKEELKKDSQQAASQVADKNDKGPTEMNSNEIIRTESTKVVAPLNGDIKDTVQEALHPAEMQDKSVEDTLTKQGESNTITKVSNDASEQIKTPHSEADDKVAASTGGGEQDKTLPSEAHTNVDKTDKDKEKTVSEKVTQEKIEKLNMSEDTMPQKVADPPKTSTLEKETTSQRKQKNSKLESTESADNAKERDDTTAKEVKDASKEPTMESSPKIAVADQDKKENVKREDAKKEIQKEPPPTNETPKVKKSDEVVKVKSPEKKSKEPLKKPIKYKASEQKEPKDCYDYYKRGNKKNGVFQIKPYGQKSMVEVFCDMKNGGWTLIQKRHDGTTKFMKKWQYFKEGFGGIRGEHWLGNDHIHYLTNQDHYTLKIELTDWNKTMKVAEYDYFMIDDEAEGYRLHIGGYHGDAGDGMAKHNNHKFSTTDVDNDKVTKEFGGSCAKRFSGAWWYYKCYMSNLNGIYYRNGVIPPKLFDGIAWKPWTGSNYSLRSAEMKIRPSNIS